MNVTDSCDAFTDANTSMRTCVGRSRDVVGGRGAGTDGRSRNGFSEYWFCAERGARAAVAPTVAVITAAADEVSAGIAHLFSQQAQDYRGAGRAGGGVPRPVCRAPLTASAGSYASSEAANAALLQPAAAIADSSASAVIVPLFPLGDFLSLMAYLISFSIYGAYFYQITI